MPNIFKSFLKPAVNSYVFPDAESLQVEESPEPEGEQAEETPLQEQEPEAPHTAAADARNYAKIQAEKNLEDARQQAEELLEQERQHIRQEAEAEKELARADGYRQGYGEGLRQARVEGAAQIEEHRKQEAERIRSFLEQAAAARDSLLEQAQNELCELSLAVAEKVIHISLRTSRDVIARMIQVATEKLKRREWVHIYVGGYEARDLAQITPELTTALAGLSEHIKIIPMSDDELGACIIEMPDEIIDASASTQLNNIRDVLSGG